MTTSVHDHQINFNQTLGTTGLALQPRMEFLPDELLLQILERISSIQRCLILSTCRKWNQSITNTIKFWKYVSIPTGTSFSTAITILQVFNQRSRFNLKEVSIANVCKSSVELDQLFDELIKSASTIKILIISTRLEHSNIRNFARTNLKSLDALMIRDTDYFPMSAISSTLQELETKVSDESSTSLKYYHGSFEHFEEEDIHWFSGLLFLHSTCTPLIKDLHAILKASKSTLRRLNLDEWIWSDVLLSPFPVWRHQKVYLENLEEIVLPFRERAARHLNRMVQVSSRVGGSPVQVRGCIESLLKFKIKDLEKVHLDVDVDETEFSQNIAHFTGSNPSIKSLTVSCEEQGSDLEEILKRLSLRRDGYGNVTAEHRKATFRLPNLKLLLLQGPLNLNDSLMKEVLESRAQLDPEFKLEVEVTNEEGFE